MAQTLSPKPVGPKAIRRWTRQALDLVGRSFHIWVAVMIAFCLLLYLVQQSMFLSSIISLSAYFVGTGIAALLDDRTHPGAVAILRRVAEDFPRALIFSMLIVVASHLFSIVGGLMHAHKFDWLYFYNPEAIPPLSQDFVGMARQLFIASLTAFALSMIVTSFPFVCSFFQYHLMALLDLSWFQSYLNGDGDVSFNFSPLILLKLILFFVPIALMGLCPMLAPVFYCFASAISYVAFREIYLGIGENRKIVVAEARALAGVSA